MRRTASIESSAECRNLNRFKPRITVATRNAQGFSHFCAKLPKDTDAPGRQRELSR